MKRILLIIVLWLSALMAVARWVPDVLGDGFEMLTINQPGDYSGQPVCCTVVRKQASPASPHAVLYVHGFNDYFFQAEMADTIVARGYDFYAVDLRKYGRSIREGTRLFEVRELDEYFADLDSAIAVMQRDGVTEIALMGHSTGGLITSYFMAFHPSPAVKALILNSPFLDWNLGSMEWLVPGVSALGRLFPKLKIPQGGSTAYAESLLRDYHGEWTYNTDWKLTKSPAVDAGWVRAIDRAQKRLREPSAEIRVPILLMASVRSVDGSEWTPAHNAGDAVLDVDDIVRYGVELGPRVTVRRVSGGLHDLVLSAPAVRRAVYSAIFTWLTPIVPPR